MAQDLQELGGLVFQRARAVERTFARLRAGDFPTHDYVLLTRFPSSVAGRVKKRIHYWLQLAHNQKVQTSNVERILRRYGQALEYVHQSLDFMINAEILSIPASFVYFLEELGSEFMQPKFVLQGAPSFNYSFRAIAPNLNQFLNQAGLGPLLPANFAVFRFPAALHEDGLQHCLLVHELGHYLDTAEHLYPSAWNDATQPTRERVERFIRTEMGYVAKGLDQGAQMLMVQGLMYWLRETVCDVFAARVLGPAYLFSVIEFTRLQTDLSRGTDTHPPSASRLSVILEELQSLGWGPDLVNVGQIAKPMRWTASRIHAEPLSREGGNRIPERHLRILERCLQELLPAIRRVMGRRVGSSAYSRRDHHSKWAGPVEQLLSKCVPPGEMGLGREAIPARAILNGAWFFHRNGYGGWRGIRGNALKQADEGRLLLSRLVLKALEISFVVSRWKGTSKKGPT